MKRLLLIVAVLALWLLVSLLSFPYVRSESLVLTQTPEPTGQAQGTPAPAETPTLVPTTVPTVMYYWFFPQVIENGDQEENR